MTFGERGQAFYDEVRGRFQFAPDEEQLLIEVCRTLDDLEALARDPDADARRRAHRAEVRHLLAALALPESDVKPGRVIQATKAAEKRWGTDAETN